MKGVCMSLDVKVIEDLLENSESYLSSLKNWPDNKFHLDTIKRKVDTLYNENVEEGFNSL